MAEPKRQEEVAQGTIVRSRKYANDWTILKVEVPGHEDSVSFVGTMGPVREGDTYEFIGTWANHPQYGLQFKFSQAELIMPTGKTGVAKYLSQITFGVGLKKAEKIVQLLGEDALDKIKSDPRVLESLEFLSSDQRRDIAKDLVENSVQAELASMICKQGIGMGTVARIMDQYGQDAVKVVKENPYVLTDDLWGVGFTKADAIAKSTGVPANSPFRIEAALDYILRESGSEGHCFLRPRDIVEKLIGRKGLVVDGNIGIPEIRAANEKLICAEKCIRIDFLPPGCGESEKVSAVYAQGLYKAEMGVAASVRRLLAQSKKEIDDIDLMIEDTEERLSGVAYATEQKQAIHMALKNPLSIITGGPGTGKTTVINAVVAIFKQTQPRAAIYLAAPTGRAAKRMSEATNREAKTIHRLLRYDPFNGGFVFGYDEKLPGPGLLIVDEASMIDIELAEDLLAAVPNNMQVVFVGDIDQLPSVGPGSVLRDLITSSKVPTTRLKFNFRQAGGSIIANNAHLICQGILPALSSEGDFEYISVEDAEQAREVVLSLAQQLVAEGKKVLEWQVLAPMRRGSCGVSSLNEAIQSIINPAKEGEILCGGYRLGDKVMVIKNNYSLDVFNGDIGVVINVAKESLIVDFGDQNVTFAVEHLSLLTLAYASTIHKSQGSEFPVVIMPLVRQHYMMLQRNLLYTGLTRAKRRLILVGDEWSIKKAVANNVIEDRFSLLAERVRGEVDNHPKA